MLAICFADADQAAFYTAQAGTYIRFAVDVCKSTATLDDRTECASAVATVIASIGWVGAYVAASINSCGKDANANQPAACAAAMSGFVAELGEFSFVASAIVTVCNVSEPARLLKATMPTVTGHSRAQHALPAGKFAAHSAKASAGSFLHKLRQSPVLRQEDADSATRAASMTQVVVDLNLGLTYIVRLGAQIYFLTKECPKADKESRKSCALDIFNVISSLAWAAQFLANVAVDMPGIDMTGASCAGVVSDFVASVAALGPVANGIMDDCQHAKLSDPGDGNLFS